MAEPNWQAWGEEIAWQASLGEGYEMNLRYDLAEALRDAYRVGLIDGKESSDG